MGVQGNRLKYEMRLRAKGPRLLQVMHTRAGICCIKSVNPPKTYTVGVRDLVARGYVIPGGASQRGGGQAPMFQCRTLSDTIRGQALRGLVGSRWIPSGLVNVPYGPVWVRISVVQRYGTDE